MSETTEEPKPNPAPPAYEVARHGSLIGGWNVGHTQDDGAVELATFLGPNAEQRARDYGDWLAGKSGGEAKAQQVEGKDPTGIRQEGPPERYGPTGQEPRSKVEHKEGDSGHLAVIPEQPEQRDPGIGAENQEPLQKENPEPPQNPPNPESRDPKGSPMKADEPGAAEAQAREAEVSKVNAVLVPEDSKTEHPHMPEEGETPEQAAKPEEPEPVEEPKPAEEPTPRRRTSLKK